MENVANIEPSPLGNKRGRESTGSGLEKHPTKRSKPTRIKERSLFLLLITKGGLEYDIYPWMSYERSRKKW